MTDQDVKTAHNLYKQVLALPSLEPSSEVNKVLTEMVDLCLSSQDIEMVKKLQHLDSSFDVNVLVNKCLAAEFCMEQSWANKIASRETNITDFWFYQNYGLSCFCLNHTC